LNEEYRKKIPEEKKKEWVEMIGGLELMLGEEAAIQRLRAYATIDVQCEMRDMIYSTEQDKYIFLCHLPDYDATVYVKTIFPRLDGLFVSNFMAGAMLKFNFKEDLR